jgi:hypothetical protein
MTRKDEEVNRILWQSAHQKFIWRAATEIINARMLEKYGELLSAKGELNSQLTLHPSLCSFRLFALSLEGCAKGLTQLGKKFA